ncbi:MAG: tetratricopeptide repeat protein, partial [Thermoleophilia bacterium]|nr:tetratricopeptide repeat protein [Thermoleophilia bacterium]
ARRADALALYARYLKFNKGDPDAAAKFARLLFDQFKAEPSGANAVTAVRGVEDVLRYHPENAAARRELAELYLKTNRHANAREHLNVIFARPDARSDVDLLELSATVAVVAGDLPLAVKELEQAIRAGAEKDAALGADDEKRKALTATRVRLYQQVLDLLQQNREDGERERKIRDHVLTLTEKEPFRKNLAARVAVVRFQLSRNELSKAAENLPVALTELGGRDNTDALLAAAEFATAEARQAPGLEAKRAKLADARKHLERANELDKKDVEVGLALARVLDMLAERQKALTVLRTTAEALGSVDDRYLLLLDRLIDYEDRELAEKLVAKLGLPADDPAVVYFNGRLALLRGEWTKARDLLVLVAPNVARIPEFHKRAMAGIARVYEVLQNPDQQLEYCRLALRDSGPALVEAVVGEAAALVKLGRLDDAVARYQALVTTYQVAALRPLLVRLRLVQTLRKPPDARNWELFDSPENLGPEVDRTDDIQLAHAQALAARGEKARALELLGPLVKKEPRSPLAGAAWVSLARIREAGNPDGAIAVLDEARKTLGDTVELRLARADALVYRPKPPTPAEFESLLTGPAAITAAEKYQLAFGLG